MAHTDLAAILSRFAEIYYSLLSEHLPLIRTFIGEIHRHHGQEESVIKSIFRPQRQQFVEQLKAAQSAGKDSRGCERRSGRRSAFRHDLHQRAAGEDLSAKRLYATRNTLRLVSPWSRRISRRRRIAVARWPKRPKVHECSGRGFFQRPLWLRPGAALAAGREASGARLAEMGDCSGGFFRRDSGGHRRQYHQCRASRYPGKSGRDAV